MIATAQDLVVRTRQDFERLPDDGRWEVVEGRAVPLPPPKYRHQRLCHRLQVLFEEKLTALGRGYITPAVTVFVPPLPGSPDVIQSRIPDLIVHSAEPKEAFEVGAPPELVIEVLSTRRGNVERTEKLDDYARAGIGEYWIVDPSERVVEVYRLERGEFVLALRTEAPHPAAFPGLEIDMRGVWTASK